MASGYNLQSLLHLNRKMRTKSLKLVQYAPGLVRTKCRPTVTAKLAIAVAAKTAT